MPRRALIDHRPWLLASLVAGISYFFVKDSAIPGLYLMAWKGAGVALLAGYALSRRGGRDAAQIGVVMALGALGDVLIELNLIWGALAFLAGHLVAIALYLRRRRTPRSPSQTALAGALLVLVPVIAFLLPADRALAPGVAFYALGLSAMAATAWTSTYPRYRVGLGAVLFVISDLLIFARQGALAGTPWPGLLIWPLYYFGQFLICVGVVGAEDGHSQGNPIRR